MYPTFIGWHAGTEANDEGVGTASHSDVGECEWSRKAKQELQQPSALTGDDALQACKCPECCSHG